MRQSRRHAANAAGARQARLGQFACRRLRCAAILLLAAVLCGAAAFAGASDHGCGGSPNPPFGPLGAPHVAVWRDGDPHSALQAPACIDWGAWHSTVVVALAGRFAGPDSDESLLSRFAAISGFEGIRYWSASARSWETLITAAAAVSGGQDQRRRRDFSAEELRQGQPVYFSVADNYSSGPVVYRMQVVASGSGRLVVAVENTTSLWVFLLPLFGPGDLHSYYVVQRLGPGLWGYYSLTGVREGALAWFGGDATSTINRAVAVYRHIAGIPTDRNPPLAPGTPSPVSWMPGGSGQPGLNGHARSD